MPMAPSERFQSSLANGSFRWKMTVSSSGASMWSTNRRCCFGAANLSVGDGVEGPLHVARSKGPAVVEVHALAKMEDVGQRVGNLPAARRAKAEG